MLYYIRLLFTPIERLATSVDCHARKGKCPSIRLVMDHCFVHFIHTDVEAIEKQYGPQCIAILMMIVDAKVAGLFCPHSIHFSQYLSTFI